MQSWQTDLLNLYLRTSVKPLLRRARSLKNARAVVRVVDQTLGRLSIPRHTRIESAQASSVNCRCDWIDPPLVGHAVHVAADRLDTGRDEDVAFAVLSRPGLEETHRRLRHVG